MFSLQKLLSKDDKFFDLLEASATEGRASVQALARIVGSSDPAPLLADFATARRKDKAIKTEIDELLCRSFVTALERDDIQTLSDTLYKIPKTAEKFAERYLISTHLTAGADFKRQIGLLDQATGIVMDMVKLLRSRTHLEQTHDLNEQLQKVEGDADKLMLELVRDLYLANTDPVRALVLRDLYELLEKVVDRCRDVGNVITNIVLKNS